MFFAADQGLSNRHSHELVTSRRRVAKLLLHRQRFPGSQQLVLNAGLIRGPSHDHHHFRSPERGAPSHHRREPKACLGRLVHLFFHGGSFGGGQHPDVLLGSRPNDDGAHHQKGRRKRTHHYSIETFRSRLKSDSILPAPRTTDDSGSSATDTGSPVSARKRSPIFCRSAPPPVSTIPRSQMSAASSGGVRSRPSRTAWMIILIGSASASRTSPSVIVTVVGFPSS